MAANEAHVEEILRISDRLFRDLLPQIPKEVLELDLTMSQFKIILTLYLNGPSKMTALAAGLGVKLATLTGVVDRLVEKRLVLREDSPEDRRVVICRLSENGYVLINSVWHSARERARELLSAIPPAQLELIGQALEVLAAAGQETARKAAPVILPGH